MTTYHSERETTSFVDTVNGRFCTYDDFAYVCGYCGSDDLMQIDCQLDDPLPKKYYWIWLCRQCGQQHIRDEWVWIVN